ncbi:hypothetical protein LPJ73_003532 [Coemansia sp. RSA 2703]|nr:hypothetical protein LPJ73_003532 [Coemansia sp. RSA 2703]
MIVSAVIEACELPSMMAGAILRGVASMRPNSTNIFLSFGKAPDKAPYSETEMVDLLPMDRPTQLTCSRILLGSQYIALTTLRKDFIFWGITIIMQQA